MATEEQIKHARHAKPSVAEAPQAGSAPAPAPAPAPVAVPVISAAPAPAVAESMPPAGQKPRKDSFGTFQFALFSLIVCLFLLGPACLYAAEKMGVDLPSWFTSEDSKYLEGGVQEADLQATANLQGFADETFQDALEITVGNYVPTKASAILGNAALQRTAIATSNLLYGWECYPGFYGCERLLYPRYNAVVDSPVPQEKYRQALERFASKLSDFAQSYPDKNFVVYLGDKSATSEINPALNLVPSAITTQQVVALMQEACSAENVTFLSDAYTDPAAYYEDYYRADHHWNMRGAVRGFNTLMAAVDRKPFKNPEYGLVDGPTFIGATARESLDLIEQQPMRLTNDFSKIQLKKGGTFQNGNEHLGYVEADEALKQWDFYGQFYQQFSSAEGTGKGSAYLINDSYGKALTRLFATSYAKVKCDASLFQEKKGDKRLADKLTSKIDDVFFVGHMGNYITFNKRNPHYFDLD